MPTTPTYDIIGRNYNLTRTADPFLTSKFLHYLDPDKDGVFLDIGCGTGNYSIALDAKGYKVRGIDPSEQMLNQARLKAPHIDWGNGTAEVTGLPEDSVDGVIGCLTMHHWQDLTHSFRELRRVAKSGSKVVIFTSTPEQMQGYWLNHYFPVMMQNSMLKMPSLDLVTSALDSAGIRLLETEKYFVQEDLQDLFLYSGKHHPELYLRDEVRNGSSSFSSLAHDTEVRAGLSMLREDIANVSVRDVMHTYTNDLGDYLFVIAVM